MGDQQFTSDTNSFRYRLLCQCTTPFINDRLPYHAAGHLFQHVSNQDTSTTKNWFAMTYFRVSDNKPTYTLGSHKFTSFTLLYDKISPNGTPGCRSIPKGHLGICRLT